MRQNIYIVSGETSGDIHGANLVKEFKKTALGLDIYTWGGDRMKSEGAIVRKHIKELSFMGFYEVIANLFKIFSNFKEIKKDIKALLPSVVVLIDYPGFNLRLLPWLKKHNFTVFYYIAPQAWAWKESRVKKMAKYIDKLFVILPFEEDFFANRGVNTEYVGHPLLDELEVVESSTMLKQIALLPGSRKQEVATILPEMLNMIDEFPQYQFVIAGVGHIEADFYKKIIKSKSCKLVWDDSQQVVSQSILALVSSGTATLQTALIGIPQIVCYKSSWINYQIGRRLIKVPYISLVNLIAEKEIVKELIQDKLNKDNLKQYMSFLLREENRESLKIEYQEIREKLGEQSASKRVAEEILKAIKL